MMEPMGETLGVELLERLRRDQWAGAGLRGALPRVPLRDTLPAASVDLAGVIVRIAGDGATTPDVVYCCLADLSGVYDWRVVSTG